MTPTLRLQFAQRWKQRPPTPLADKLVFLAGGAATLVAFRLGRMSLVEPIFLISFLLLSGMAALDWWRGRPGGRSRYRNRAVIFPLLCVLPLTALAATTYFSPRLDHLPGEIETDRYVLENADSFAANARHFVELHERDQLKVGMHNVSDVPLNLVSFSLLRAPLIARNWIGDIEGEDVIRHDLWRLADLRQVWAVSPKSPSKHAIPHGAKHPYIAAITCMEDHHGVITTSAMLGALPSHDTEQPGFTAFAPGDLPEGIIPAHPGLIQPPSIFYGLDVSSLPALSPLVDICVATTPGTP